jgi:hypothetical protein
MAHSSSSGGVGDSGSASTSAALADANYRAVLAYAANDVAAAYSIALRTAGTIAADTTWTPPTGPPAGLWIGNQFNDAAHINGHIRRWVFKPFRDSDTSILEWAKGA